jgi:hypothetical protein
MEAVNDALLALAAILTDPGTVTAVLLLVSDTVSALVVAPESATVHAAEPAPVNEEGLQERELSLTAGAVVTEIELPDPELEMGSPLAFDTNTALSARGTDDAGFAAS